jgi:RHS repeat-associated protein
VRNSFGASVVSQYDYAYDAIGRRTSVKNSGSAFAAAAFTKWGYDNRNQVTASNRYLGTSITDLSNPVNPEQRAFQYDPIGNRETSTAAGVATSYTPNELNQYGAVGSAAPTYDDDGNLMTDGSKVLAYNGENQLKSVTVPSVSVSTYDYDYIGRRVKKSVDVLDGSGPDYVVTWVYDGWNAVQESKSVAGSAATVKNFVWGLDVSQSVQGAGGIGGLLAAVDGTGRANLAVYDGNGNISQLVAANGGRVDARYEYDAFGNIVLATGTLASENNWRFSTKYADDETRLVYYGYRYYEATSGRWLNRDPIGETGGANLYGFVVNQPLAFVDPDGRKCVVSRKGQRRALVTCDECADKLEDVADMVRMELLDYENWLMPTDGKPLPAPQSSGSFGEPRAFSVPNVFNVGVGEVTEFYERLGWWVLDGFADERAAEYSALGFMSLQTIASLLHKFRRGSVTLTLTGQSIMGTAHQWNWQTKNHLVPMERSCICTTRLPNCECTDATARI